jgi:RNA-directed DNA polymerase
MNGDSPEIIKFRDADGIHITGRQQRELVKGKSSLQRRDFNPSMPTKDLFRPWGLRSVASRSQGAYEKRAEEVMNSKADSTQSDGLQNRRSRVMPVEGAVHKGAPGIETQPPCLELGEGLETKLNRIAERSRRYPQVKHTSLAYLINEEHLKESFRGLEADKACGIDGVTKEEYAKIIDLRIPELVAEMKRQAYKPPGVKRVYIPKAAGKMRPLGIPTLESKMVQSAMRRILEAVYEPMFLDCSYGFRPKRSCHDALKKVDEVVGTGRIHYIVEVDIKGYFDHVDHGWLMKFLQIRIADRNLLRLIARFLKAGIWEEGKWRKTEEGTPQGGIISPILANVYLHYVLDEWFEKEYRRSGKTKAALIRYVDDFVGCFEIKEEAEGFRKAVEERMRAYGLELEQSKTRVVAFSPRRFGKGSGVFEFLGFTHYVGRSRKGYFRMKRRTSGKKFRMKIAAFKKWIQETRNQMTLAELWAKIRAKLVGHYRYYGVTDNFKRVQEFRYRVVEMLFKWLNRRSQKKSMNWDDFNRYLNRYPLPIPRIYFNIYA